MLETLHVVNGNVVQLSGGTRPDADDLLLDRVGRVLPLLEQLHETSPSVQLAA